MTNIATPMDMLAAKKRIADEEAMKKAKRDAEIAAEIAREVPEILEKFSKYVRYTGDCNFDKALEHKYFRSYVADAVVTELNKVGWKARAACVLGDRDNHMGFAYSVEVHP